MHSLSNFVFPLRIRQESGRLKSLRPLISLRSGSDRLFSSAFGLGAVVIQDEVRETVGDEHGFEGDEKKYHGAKANK